MAYQFADGFDNYGNAYSFTNGYPWDLAQNVTSSTADFRFATVGSLPAACAVCNSGTQNILRKNLSTTVSSVIVNFGLKMGALPSSSVTDFVQFWNAGACQGSLAVNSTGQLQFYRSNGSTLGGGLASTNTAIGAITASSTIAANTWYGIQLQYTCATSTGGSVSCYINGSATAAINSTGLNTSGDGTSNITQVSIGPCSNSTGATTKFDDFFVLDTTTTSLNALLGGDARILTKMPASAGNYTNWTPTGLAANWQNAAVQPPSTSDYNANNVGSTKDSYTMQSASLIVPPYFVVARASMERDDAGPHTPSIFVRSNATDSAGVVTAALGASYLFYDAIFATDPSTGLAWTGPGADNAQVGVIEG